MTSLASGGLIAPFVIVVEEAPGGYYEGHNVSIDSTPLWWRPYDGETRERIAQEVVEALCDVLRAHTGNRAIRLDEEDCGD